MLHVDHYRAKIKAIEKDIQRLEDRSDFTGNEPRYNFLKDRLDMANNRLDEANDRLTEANECLDKARVFYLRLGAGRISNDDRAEASKRQKVINGAVKMEHKNVRVANLAVVEASAEVNHYSSKIKAIEKEIKDLENTSEFTGNEPRYYILKDRLDKANECLEKARDFYLRLSAGRISNDDRAEVSKRQKVISDVTPFDIPLHPLFDASNNFKSLNALSCTSDFKAIREMSLHYVDKTKSVLDSVKEESPSHVFIYRPWRFGKTLIVSVLEHLFLGHEALFNGLCAEKNWDWKKSLQFSGLI
jgi:hypothetical protein